MSLGEDAGNCHVVGWELVGRGDEQLLVLSGFVEKASKDTHDSIEIF